MMGFIDINVTTRISDKKLKVCNTGIISVTKNVTTSSQINRNVDLYKHSSYNNFFRAILSEELPFIKTQKGLHTKRVC